MVSPAEIQHTRLKGELVFQGFCLELFRCYWGDDLAEAHGRSGQSQYGADITGQDYRNGFRHAAVQCKASETDDPRALTVKELLDEVELAKKFVPKLDILYVAFGGNRDGALTRKAMEITAEHENEEMFKLVVWSWDDIVARALNFPEVIQKLLVHNDVPTTNTLDPKRPAANVLQDMEAAFQSILSKHSTPLSEQPAHTGNPALDAKLDVFRDQLLAGNGKLFVQSLRDFIATLPVDIHPHVRFRGYANLGSALVQSGDIEGAAIAYDAGADAELGTSDCHAYRARAAMLRDDWPLAAKEAAKAMQLGPDRFSCSLYLETVDKGADPEKLEAEVAQHIGEVEVASSLAEHYAACGRHQDAIRLARGVKKQDWQKDGVLAGALIGQFEHDIALRIGAPMTGSEQHQIDEARVLLERAWSKVKERSDLANWTHLAANLCSVYLLQSNEIMADELAFEVFKITPKAPSIAERAALAFVRRSELEKAQEALAVLFDSPVASSVKLLAGNIAVLQKDWPRAYQFGEEAFHSAKTDDDKAHAAELMVNVRARDGGPVAEALTLASRLRTEFSPNIGFESRVAETARRSGDAAEIGSAEARLDAFGSVDALNAMDKFLLADAYADGDQWSRAADLLNGLYTLDQPSKVLKRRLFALYRADRRSDGRALYQSLQGEAAKSPELMRLGAALYERSGLLKEASRELSKALALDGDDLRSRLDWVRLSYRSGDKEAVRKWAKRTEVPADAEPKDLMEFAQLMNHLGRRKQALSAGYRALRKGWGSSEELHTGYMSLFLLSAKNESFLKPTKVSEDSVVLLKDDGGSLKQFRIEKHDIPDRDLIAPNHPFALELLGKSVGDTFVLKACLGQDVSFKIQEIKHKYLDLFHTVIEGHNTLFPRSMALGKFQIDPADQKSLEPIFEQARNRARAVENAVDLYKANPMPIDGMAKLLGTDSIDASRGLRFRSGVDLDTCVGALEEREIALNSVDTEARILVDAVTLSIWNEIDFLEDLEQLGIRPTVIQATVDILAQRASNARSDIAQTGGSLEASGDKVHFIEVTKVDRANYAEAQEKLFDWVRQNADIVPSEAFENDLLTAAEDLLSRSSYDTITTGLGSHTLLLIEDRRTRQIAQAAGAQLVSWTQPVLMTYQQDGRLSKDRYIALIAKLIRHKVGFVAVSDADLVEASALGHDAEDFQTLCDAIMRPNVDPATIVGVAAGFLTEPWINAKVPNFRFASEILERAAARRDDFRVFKAIVNQVDINIRSYGFPVKLLSKLWIEYVDGFIAGHFLKGVLLRKQLPAPKSNISKRRNFS